LAGGAAAGAGTPPPCSRPRRCAPTSPQRMRRPNARPSWRPLMKGERRCQSC
jgi:hypothetical protein